jgi:hypothetical protein
MRLTNIQRQWINQNVSAQGYLEELMGHEIPQNGMCFCPFHHNENTKASKFYPDSNRLYCFYEKRHFFTVDILFKLGWTIEKILGLLPVDMGDFQIAERMKHPVVKPVVKEKQKDNFLAYLTQLDEIWKETVNQNRDAVNN